MEERRFVALSVLLALVWGGTVLAWLLHVAKDRARRVSTLVMVGFALALGPFGFSKNGGNPPLRSGAAASPPVVSLLLSEVRMNKVFDLSMPSNAVVHEPWLRRGASDDWFWLHATNALFRAGTNVVRSVRVSSRGMLAFPDGSRLEPFHAVLGVLPEPNWTNAPSRVWHAPAAGGGRLLTWENAALERNPATPVSFQAELRRDGGVVGRYDLPHPATNFAIAAFGETALAVRGGVTNAATVRRVDGAAIPETSLAELLRDATRFELIWRTAEGDPDADPDGDGLTTRDEIGRHGTDPKQADTDGDGLSDASELLLGSNPLDADENGDGVPDGVDPATWAAHSLWPTNETGNIIVSLVEAIPTNMAATFQIGDLSIPLRDPDTWTFSLEPGVAYAYRLFVTDGATANLAITNDIPRPPMRGATSWGQPLWDEGTGGVFDGPSFGGEGEMAIPLATLTWDNPHNGSHGVGNSICLHGGDEAVFTPSLLPAIAGDWTLDGFSRRGISFVLSVPDSGVVHYGAATLAPGALRFGEVTLSADAHGCFATRIEPFCSVCGEYEPEDAELWIESDTLTLKHDDQLLFGIFHEYSPNILYENPSIEIRRQRDSEWLPLGSLADLTPWTARVAGTFFVRGRAVVSGRPVWTQEEALEVRFPDYDDIADDGNVLLAMESAWRRTKDEASPSGRCEFGFWIRLDTRNGRYITEPLEYGLDTSSSSGGVLLPSPRPADVPLDPAANATGAVYTVGHFHTHTPRTYLLPTNLFRLVGPSDADVRFCSGKHLPGIVCDYVGDSYTGETTNRLYNGHNLEAPDMLYPVPPERRPIP